MSTGKEKSIEALAAHGRQSVKETRQKLELALRRLVDGNPCMVKKGAKISACSVAKEAGVDRATLYRFHEPVLAEISKINDAMPKALLKESRSKLAASNDKLKEYRQLVEESQEEVKALARANYGLKERNRELEEHIRVRDEQIADFQSQVNSCATIHKLRT
jgi:hypothetical protein